MPGGAIRPMTDFSPYMRDVALELLGEPNKRMSSKDELRWGSNGSMSVDLKKGTFFDHQAKAGGGVLDLIARETGGNANGAAIDWLRARGFAVDDFEPNGSAADFTAHTAPNKRIVATYDYTDETGDLVMQVVRYEPKTFRQRRKAKPDDPPDKVRDGWVWSVKGVRLVPFQLAELIEAIAEERLVFIVEGEKDVLNLAAAGVPATCNPMGAGKWPPGFPEFFRDADVVILPDNDETGRGHANLVAASIAGMARRVRVLEIPDLPEKADVSDWLKAGHDAGELYDLVDARAVAWSATTAKLNFEAVWFADAETAMQDPEWLVDDLLTRGDMSLIYGESQSGKSFLATHIAMAVARGVDVFDRKVMHPGGVVYVAAEGKKGFKWRLSAYRDHFGLPKRADIPFVLFPVAVDMFAEEGDYPKFLADLQVIAAQMKERGIALELVVFDTHAAVSPGANENASEDVSRLMKHYARVQQVVPGVHVQIVHHKNAGGDKPRGHTSLYAGVDNAIEVFKDEVGHRIARVAKLKDGEDGGKIGFRLQVVEIGKRSDGKTVTSCVVEPHEGTSQRRRGPTLTAQEKIGLQALHEALGAAGEPAPRVLGLPNGVTVVRIDYWKQQFMSRAFNERPNESTFRNALKRVSDGLMAKNVIGRNEPYVWIAREPSI